MTEKNGADARGNSPQAERKFSIPVKLGCIEERFVELELGSSVTAILEVVAAERGCNVEELILVREGETEPLTPAIVVDANYFHQRRHHVHHTGEVAVTVYYQEGEHRRAFKRFEAVKDVLAWAIEVFDIDSSMAAEFELARRGHKEELHGPEHVGHLAGKDCELALDLVRGDIANGSCL